MMCKVSGVQSLILWLLDSQHLSVYNNESYNNISDHKLWVSVVGSVVRKVI